MVGITSFKSDKSLTIAETQKLKVNLKKWNKETFGNVSQKKGFAADN